MIIKTADEIYAEWKKEFIRDKMMSALTHARREIWADTDCEFRIATNKPGYSVSNTETAISRGAA